MATKLKRYNIWLKIVAFTGLVALTCGMILSIFNMQPTFSKIIYMDDINKTDYTYTRSGIYEQWEITRILDTIYTLGDEESIKNGKFITASDIQIEKNNMFYYFESSLYNALYNGSFDWSQITEETLWEKFEEFYKDEINRIQEVLISNQLNEYKNALDSLQEYSYITYYINTDKPVLNSALSPDEILSREYSYKETQSNKVKWAYSFSDNYINTKNDELAVAKKAIYNFIIYFTPIFISAIICAIYLIYASGRNASESKRIHLLYIDKLYNEITVGLLVLSFIGVLLLIQGIFTEMYHIYLYVSALVVIMTIFYFLVSMLIRHIKARTLFKNTIIYTIFSKIAGGIKKIYSRGTPMVKTILLIVILGIFTMIPFIGFVTIPFAVWLAYRQVVGFQKLRDGIALVKSGAYNQKIAVDGKGEFSILASNVNEIATGLSSEVERRIKSERLKTELIVNVSHDIKTPLTSLITYTDLLKKEETENENIKKYVEVLSQKSNRLRILIEDLFESSKAASGNIEET